MQFQNIAISYLKSSEKKLNLKKNCGSNQLCTILSIENSYDINITFVHIAGCFCCFCGTLQASMESQKKCLYDTKPITCCGISSENDSSTAEKKSTHKLCLFKFNFRMCFFIFFFLEKHRHWNYKGRYNIEMPKRAHQTTTTAKKQFFLYLFCCHDVPIYMAL